MISLLSCLCACVSHRGKKLTGVDHFDMVTSKHRLLTIVAEGRISDGGLLNNREKKWCHTLTTWDLHAWNPSLSPDEITERDPCGKLIWDGEEKKRGSSGDLHTMFSIHGWAFRGIDTPLEITSGENSCGVV